MKSLNIFMAFSFVFCGGCTHLQLRNNTARQARTVSEMHTQQVLDNLAMFSYEPGSFPSFSTFKQGTSTVVDAGQFATPFTIGRIAGGVLGLAQLGINPSLSRQSQEAWTIEPINDPRKLELMRCAYQQAVANCRPVFTTGCPDCQKRFSNFYTGSATGQVADATTKGITTSDCLTGSCWYCIGCKGCAPADCCDYVGHYCGTCIWVPTSGRDELSKLTLAILDYAFNEPKKPVQSLKEVTWYLDKDLQPTTGEYALKLRAEIAAEDDPRAILDAPTAKDRLRLRALLKSADIQASDFRLYGPFVYLKQGKLTEQEVAEIIVILANLESEPAKAFMDFSRTATPSLLDLVGERHGLNRDKAEELLKLKAAFTQMSDEKARANAKSLLNLTEAVLDSLREHKGLSTLELEVKPLTPIVLPSMPSGGGADNILQLRQELNTATPPAIMSP